MDSTSSYLAFIAYELYISAMCCVSTIVFLSLSPLSFTAFYSMLLVEKRSDVLLCFLCFHLFLRFLFRIDDADSLKQKDQSNSQRSSPSSYPAYSQPSPPVTTYRPIPIYHEPPSSTPPRRSKQSSSSPAFYQPPSPAPPRRSKRRSLSPACSHLPSSAPPRRSKRSSQSPAFSQAPYSPQFSPPSPASSYLPSTLSFLSPPPLPPFKMKDWKYIWEGDYVRMGSEVSLSSDSDTSDINVRSDRFIAENKERFRAEIREDQLRFLNRKMSK